MQSHCIQGMKKRYFLALNCATVLLSLGPQTELAQAKLPKRPIRVMAPFAPDGDGVFARNAAKSSRRSGISQRPRESGRRSIHIGKP